MRENLLDCRKEEEDKEPESDDDKEDEEKENPTSDITVQWKVPEGFGWLAIEKATKCTKAEIIKLNAKMEDWEPEANQSIYIFDRN